MPHEYDRAGLLYAALLTAVLCGPSLCRAQEGINTADRDKVNLRRTVTVEVVERTKGAVVNVSTTKLINRRLSPFGADPFWQQFDFGDVQRIPANSLGSGIIIHKDGYVVTNNHVIDRARQITVELVDGRKLPAALISADADADLAVLKIADDKPLPTIELGDSSDLMIGEPVIAVGNPLGYSHSVSTGIVSALHRDLKDAHDKVMLADLIQTDAAINPGNSGGPLQNAYGQVIGINTAIRSDAQNIGFSIPINRLLNLIPELMNPAQAIKVDVPLRLAEHRILNPPATIECQVETMEKPAGADQKNQPPGRIIKSINGEHPANLVDAYAILLRAKAGQTMEVVFQDNKREKIVPQAVAPPDAIVQAKKRLGLTIEPLTPMLAEKYRLTAEDGMFVSAVDRDGVGAKAGLQAGDIIVQLGRYRVSSLSDFAALLQHLPDKGHVRMGVIRGEQVGVGTLDLQ